MPEVEALASFRQLLSPFSATAACRVILAVSGGCDSLALLLLAARSARRLAADGFFFDVVTIDHGLRPASAAEADTVASLARSFGLPHRTLRWGGTPGANLQARAREARYRLLVETADAIGAVAVMTGHHQDDQIETHLLAAARHAGDRGLAGMRPVRDLSPRVKLLRPFLGVPGARLKAAVEAAGLDAVDDASNRDPRFERVRVRRMLADEGADRARILADIAAHAARRDADDACLAACLAALLETGELAVDPRGLVRVSRDAFGRVAEDVALALLGRLLAAVGGAPHPPERVATGRLLARVRDRKSLATAATLGGVRLDADPSRIVFAREYGRAGPPSVAVPPQAHRTVFDDRFDVAFDAGGCSRRSAASKSASDATGEGDALVAFGRLGRGNLVERCLPVRLSATGEVRAAAPPVLAKLPAGTAPLALTERVSWRIAADLPMPAGAASRGNTAADTAAD